MKYKTTKKAPFKKWVKWKTTQHSIIMDIPNGIGYDISYKDLWLKEGWIKPIKENNWIIDIEDNWKLKKADRYNSCGDEPFFKSKKAALNYVLNEAKDRFKNGYTRKQYHDSSCDTIELCIGRKYAGEKIKIIFDDYNGSVLWTEKQGWIAEPIQKTYPKTDAEIIHFAPGRHYYIDYDSLDIDIYKQNYNAKTSLPTKELAEAFLSLMKLIKYRNAWWEVDNWEPNYVDDEFLNHVIITKSNKIYKTAYYSFNHILSFKTPEIRDEFYETFKEDIEKAKELL